MLSVSLPLTAVPLADARPQGSAEGGAQASPRPGARARGHQGPQAEPQGDAKLPQGGVRGPHQVQLLSVCLYECVQISIRGQFHPPSQSSPTLIAIRRNCNCNFWTFSNKIAEMKCRKLV